MSPSLLQTLEWWGGRTACRENFWQTSHPCPPNRPLPRPQPEPRQPRPPPKRPKSRWDCRGWTAQSSTPSTRCARLPKGSSTAARLAAAASTWSAHFYATSATSTRAGSFRIRAASAARCSSAPIISRSTWRRSTTYPRPAGGILKTRPRQLPTLPSLRLWRQRWLLWRTSCPFHLPRPFPPNRPPKKNSKRQI